MSDPNGMLVCADMRALIEEMRETRKVLARGVGALERIAGTFESERAMFNTAHANDAVDDLILAVLDATPRSLADISERLRARYDADNTRAFDGNVSVLQTRLALLAMMGKAFESFGHKWSLVGSSL